MNDFLMAALIAGGGGFALSQIDSANATKERQASCVAAGETWATTPSPGVCKNAQGTEVNSAYTLWGPAVDWGIPMAAAILLYPSLPGIIGAGLGCGILLLLAASAIS